MHDERASAETLNYSKIDLFGKNLTRDHPQCVQLLRCLISTILRCKQIFIERYKNCISSFRTGFDLPNPFWSQSWKKFSNVFVYCGFSKERKCLYFSIRYVTWKQFRIKWMSRWLRASKFERRQTYCCTILFYEVFDASDCIRRKTQLFRPNWFFFFFFFFFFYWLMKKYEKILNLME